jgi:hypothetical protein
MPFNFREGMRRLGSVLGGVGGIAGAIGGFFVMDAHTSATKRLLGEPVWWITLSLRCFQSPRPALWYRKMV